MSEGNVKASCVVKNTEKLLEEKRLLDFTVRVEDVELPCHRVILAASSHFFRALLMTDMKEAKEGCVTINGISLDIFQLILKSMYTGKITLTIDNCMDLWQAADQLQIDFIVENCADFATKVTSVENFEDMWKIAKNYNSDKLCSFLDKFLLDNFDTISQINVRAIMELGFIDFNRLIVSYDLNVRNEDWLLKLVLKWVEYIPEKDNNEDKLTDTKNESASEIISDNASELSLIPTETDKLNKIQSNRIRKLTSLLNSVRTCLVSTPLLKHLLKHRLIINNTEARDILIDAVLYKTTHYNHGQWRTSAIHRGSSEWLNCGVICINNEFVIVEAYEPNVYTCVQCSELRLDVSLVVFDSYLFATGVKDSAETNSSLYVLCRKSWKKITEIPGRRLILVSYDQCIFILSKNKPEIYQIFPKCWNPKVEEFSKLPEIFKVRQAIHYERMILIFSSVTVNGEEKTAVHQLDILTKKLTELEQLNGPAKHLISFSDDDSNYILQKNGDMHTIKCELGKVVFQLIGTMENLPRKFQGALTYKKRLVISYPVLSEKQFKKVHFDMLKDYFEEFSGWGYIDFPCSNLIPAVLPKNELTLLGKKTNSF
ncbi:kelch-like protein 22 [Physella acuta]|uniref:kelch-like protein 22 n=1 Tax=Physella acuta TaxID=109671 RepID=UPI0027DE2FE7|nr:kelch-like protein 22 [Physella acuta]